MLPFRRFKDDANVLDQCVTMIEDTIHDIEEYVNKDERKTESLTETLSYLMDVYSEMLDVLEDDDMTVNPRLHYRMYPTVQVFAVSHGDDAWCAHIVFLPPKLFM